MGGLNHGRKYTISVNVTKNSKEKEGVFFSEKTNKWVVNIINETKSKYARPITRFAQFDTKEDAETCFNRLKNL